MKTAARPQLRPERTAAAAAMQAVSAASTTEIRTRDAVVQALSADGPLTAADLSERLGLTAAGVRRHLDALLDEGAVTYRELTARGPRGRGRPARAYLLTQAGRDRMPHAYDELAVQALEYLADTLGPDAVADFARRRAEAVLAPYRADLAGAGGIAERAEILTAALSAAGFSASLEQVGVGEQICQHHCPVGHVAGRFPQLCEEELAVFTEALGTYGQRLATIAHGDAACTTFIPVAAVTGHHHPAAPASPSDIPPLPTEGPVS